MKIRQLQRWAGWRGRGLDMFMGGLAVLGLAPFFLWPLSILAFAYLFIRLDGCAQLPGASKAGFGRAFWFAFGYFLFGLYWIGAAFIARGAGYIWIMPFAILVLCAGLALIWAAAGWIFARTAPRFGAWSWLWFAALMFCAEWFRGHAFSGFPWNLPGYIFKAGGPISQFASVIGIYGLSAIVLVIAASLGQSVLRAKPILFAVFIGVFAAMFGFGQARLSNANIDYVPGVKLRLVHSDISQKDKMDASKYVDNANEFLRLSASPGLDTITHVIWPEGTLPGLMFEDKNLMAVIGTTLASGDGPTPVFIAQTLRADNSSGKTKYYNSAAAVTFTKDGAAHISPYYDKQKLVPFGEFMPGGKLADALGLKVLSSAFESMTAGEGDMTPILPGLPPASIQSCYEILFPGFTPKEIEPSGAAPQWILNLSNDSWYGDSLGPQQQANQAGYRAIETGLPIIRASSGGIYALIDPYGRTIASLPLDVSQVLDVGLPYALKK